MCWILLPDLALQPASHHTQYTQPAPVSLLLAGWRRRRRRPYVIKPGMLQFAVQSIVNQCTATADRLLILLLRPIPSSPLPISSGG